MQSHVLHSSTEEFTSVTTTVTSFVEEETSAAHQVHVNGSDGENNNPDDIYGDIVGPEATAVVRSKNGKPKRKNKAGPKSRKTRAAAKKKYLIEQREDDEESLDLQLEDDVSEMNDATDQSNGSEPPHNGTNGHSVDDVIKSTDDFDNLVCEEKIAKDDETIPTVDAVNNKDAPVVYDDMIGDDEINRELTEDYDLDLDEDRSLADLAADHKILLHTTQPVVDTEIHKSPIKAKATDNSAEPDIVVTDDVQCASSDDSFITATDPPAKQEQPSTSHRPEMTEEEFNAPFVRYLGSVSGRRPLHSSSQPAPGTSQFDSPARLVPGESSRNIFKYFGFTNKQSYSVNDSAPSYGKRKADSPILVDDTSLKKLKADGEPKTSKFMSSVYNLFRSTPIVVPLESEDWTKDLEKDVEKALEKNAENDPKMDVENGLETDEEKDLVLEAGEVSGINVDGEDVVGMEELPVLQKGVETNKWCSVM